MFKVPWPGEPFLNASDDERINTEQDIYDEENLILQESVNSMEDNLEKDSLQLCFYAEFFWTNWYQHFPNDIEDAYSKI